MAVVYYKNGKTGRTYAYESKAAWNPELGYSVPKRKYLGRVDDNGVIIPSNGRRGRKPKAGPSPGKDAAEADRLRRQIASLQAENSRLKAELSDMRKKQEKYLSLIRKVHDSTAV